jgi:hypothetical protein
MLLPVEAFAGFLFRPVFRALEEWAERVRQSQPLEPSTWRLIRERAASETSQWANSHAILFVVAVAPLTGAIATFGAAATTDASIVVQAPVGALGALLGLFLSIAFISLGFLFRAIPTVREERREAQEARNQRITSLEEQLARPRAANAALEDHEMALSSLLFQVENARKYPGAHYLAEPINRELDAIRLTLETYKLGQGLDGAFAAEVSDGMDQDELWDLVAAAQEELAGISFSVFRVLPMLGD